MKKIYTAIFLSLFLLMSCGQNKAEDENYQQKLPKITVQPIEGEEQKPLESKTGSSNIDSSGSSSTSSGQLSDSGADETLQEIDKIIEDISNEK